MPARLGVIVVALLLSRSVQGAAAPSSSSSTPSCRFALEYTPKSIAENPSKFASDLLYWEGKFHSNNVGYNTANGMSYDGTLLDPVTGINTQGHPFSAPSKESLQNMVYTHAIMGSKDAARFLAPDAPETAPQVAFDVLTKKLATYRLFNQTYPGYGGWLPWYLQNGSQPLTPTWDWVNRVPALDNGENLWAIYSVVEALNSVGNPEFKALAAGWQEYLDYTKTTASKIFYAGNGRVCSVTDIANQSLPVNDPNQNYTCEGSGALNDPYEGELFTWWLYLYGGLPEKDREILWQVKRERLVRVDYQSAEFPDITVQKGFWFSSHENWKFMEMPYLDIPLLKRIYYNNERARTCNSVATKTPGMYASINNSTDSTGQIIGYISNAGIPSIANQTVQELDVITPYSVFPVMLIDKVVGLTWWQHMTKAKKMQNPYGSTESTRVDGTAISSFVSWDSKITTVNALLGGVYNVVRTKMQREGIYDVFIARMTKEYNLKFGPQTGGLKGEDVPFCLPSVEVPDTGLVDYTMCHT